MTVLHMVDPLRNEGKVVYEGTARKEGLRAAAAALNRNNLRGLAQVPTTRGTRYYAPGASDYEGESVEVVW